MNDSPQPEHRSVGTRWAELGIAAFLMALALLVIADSLRAGIGWADIPTCASAGIPVDYLMLRGIFMPPGVTPDQVAFYVQLFGKLRALPEIGRAHV